MKLLIKFSFNLAPLIALALIPFSANAQKLTRENTRMKSAGTKGGGNILENDFKKRRDNFREDFLLAGGAKLLDFSKPPIAIDSERYEQEMIELTAPEEFPRPENNFHFKPAAVRVEFVSQKKNKLLPPFERVEVDNISKACAGFPKRKLIRCVSEEYSALPVEERNAQVVHEYNVVGRFEVTSDYSLAGQMGAYQEEVTEYRLTVKPAGDGLPSFRIPGDEDCWHAVKLHDLMSDLLSETGACASSLSIKARDGSFFHMTPKVYEVNIDLFRDYTKVFLSYFDREKLGACEQRKELEYGSEALKKFRSDPTYKSQFNSHGELIGYGFEDAIKFGMSVTPMKDGRIVPQSARCIKKLQELLRNI